MPSTDADDAVEWDEDMVYRVPELNDSIRCFHEARASLLSVERSIRSALQAEVTRSAQAKTKLEAALDEAKGSEAAAIREAREAKRELDSLRKTRSEEGAEAERQLEELKQELEAKRTELESAQAEAEAARTECEKHKRESEWKDDALVKLESRNDRMTKELDDLAWFKQQMEGLGDIASRASSLCPVRRPISKMETVEAVASKLLEPCRSASVSPEASIADENEREDEDAEFVADLSPTATRALARVGLTQAAERADLENEEGSPQSPLGVPRRRPFAQLLPAKDRTEMSRDKAPGYEERSSDGGPRRLPPPPPPPLQLERDGLRRRSSRSRSRSHPGFGQPRARAMRRGVSRPPLARVRTPPLAVGASLAAYPLSLAGSRSRESNGNLLDRTRVDTTGKVKGKRVCVPYITTRCYGGSACVDVHLPREEGNRLVARLEKKKCREALKCRRRSCVYIHPSGHKARGASGSSGESVDERLQDQRSPLRRRRRGDNASKEAKGISCTTRPKARVEDGGSSSESSQEASAESGDEKRQAAAQKAVERIVRRKEKEEGE